MPVADLCKLAASQQAPRFYIDARRALDKYSLYKKGMCRVRHEERRKMYAEIFARYEAMISRIPEANQRPYRKPFMEKVLSQPAPSFYFEDDSAVKLYYRYMSDRRRSNRSR